MPTNPLNYLMKELNGQGDFTRSWTKLSDVDKAIFKLWAVEEMVALGIE